MPDYDDVMQMQKTWVEENKSTDTKQETTEQKQETSTDEGVKEEVRQPVTKTKEETEEAAKQEATTKETKPTEKQFFEIVNEKFGKTFNSDDDIKSLFEKTDLTKNYDELEQAIQKHKEEATKFLEYTRPEKWFGTPENYKNYQITQKLIGEGYDAESVNIVLRSNLKEFNDLELVTLNSLLENPELSDNDAAMLALAEIGVDIDENASEKEIDEAFENLTTLQKAKLKNKANASKKNLTAIKNTEVPEAEDYFKTIEERDNQEKQKREERENVLREGWKSKYDSIRSAVETIEITDMIDDIEEKLGWSVEKETLAKIPEIIEKFMLKHNLEPTDENVKLAVNTFIDQYKKENWKKIYDAGRKEVRDRLTEKFIKERENPTSFSQKTNTAGKKTDDDVASNQMQNLVGKL